MCKELIEDQIIKVSKVIKEISQQVLIDVFFKFSSRDKLNSYIQQYLDYSLMNPF